MLILEGGDGVSCTKPTNETFECIVGTGATGTLRVRNYAGGDYLICGAGLQMSGFHVPLVCDPLDELCVEPVPNYHYTDFVLPAGDASGISLVISPVGSC